MSQSWPKQTLTSRSSTLSTDEANHHHGAAGGACARAGPRDYLRRADLQGRCEEAAAFGSARLLRVLRASNSRPDMRPTASRIDHFHPQSITIDDPVCRSRLAGTAPTTSGTAWVNLLLCCDGGAERTCDVGKRDTHICARFLNPKDVSQVVDRLLDVGNGGRVTARPLLPPGSQEVVDDVLRLNATALVSARSETLAALKAEAARRSAAARSRWSRRKRNDLAEVLRDRAAAGDSRRTRPYT